MNEAITLPPRDAEHERILSIVFDISPQQASVLSCLSRAQVVTADELLEYTGAMSHIKVVVSRTRSKVREKGFDIKSRMGAGYWIEPDDKKGIEALVQKFMGGE
jgi:hypothetical protein